MATLNEPTAPSFPPEAGPLAPEFWRAVDAIPGWLTLAQAEVLAGAVRALPPHSLVVEIGSHQGRSTCVLAGARNDVTVIAIDPFTTTRRYAGANVRPQLEANLDRLGLRARVRIVQARSQDVRPQWTDDVNLLWIDGKHDYWTVRDDLRWARFVPLGGHILVHDAFSSLGVTTAILRQQCSRRALAYRGRVGSLATFEVAPASMANRYAVVRELPWWGRNLVVKVLLRMRLNRAAALLGHRDLVDPY